MPSNIPRAAGGLPRGSPTTATTRLDNNPLENATRPIISGRENWLFAGSETAGERAAAIMSLIATRQRGTARCDRPMLTIVLTQSPEEFLTQAFGSSDGEVGACHLMLLRDCVIILRVARTAARGRRSRMASTTA